MKLALRAAGEVPRRDGGGAAGGAGAWSALMWQRQSAMQQRGRRRQAARRCTTLVFERLRARGEAHGRAAGRFADQPAVLLRPGCDRRDRARRRCASRTSRYVLVFDPQGRIVHDGSGDIPAYGQRDERSARVRGDRRAQRCTRRSERRRRHRQPDHDRRPAPRRRARGLFAGGDARRRGPRAADAMRTRLDEIGARHLRLDRPAAGWRCSALGAIVASLVLQRTLVRPIRQLADVAHEIEAGNFDADDAGEHAAATKSATWCARSAA